MSDMQWHITGRPNCLGTYTVFRGHGETVANQVCATETLEQAHLVSAAPDLLAALIHCHDWILSQQDHTKPGEEMRLEARAAIDKARGTT